MPWDGSGQFVRIFGATGWVNDAATAVNILASRHDTHDQDIAVGIQNAITKDGQSKPAAHLIPNVDNTYDLGSVSKRWRTIYATGIPSTGISYNQTTAELNAGVTPTNPAYQPGYIERYGADNLGIASSAAA